MFTFGSAAQLIASEPVELSPHPVREVFTNASLQFLVAAYQIKGDPALTNSTFATGLERFSATNATLLDIARAGSSLQTAFQKAGHTNVTITVGLAEITNGIVTMNVFRGSIPQLVIDGHRCAFEETDLPSPSTAAAPQQTSSKGVQAGTNAASTNNPSFLVKAYEIRGDTLLSTNTLISLLEKYTGTNITVADIVQAGSDLQMEYRRRGYPTVNVTIPPQKLDSNAIVKIRVLQGSLAEVNVTGNRYFSSNNVMRALPSLHTNMIMVEPVFQAELDRANANQDRQIYPQIEPGPRPGTSALDLKVKDRLPLHAKVELNNQNSPGTPVQRLNSSMVYNNLWQYDHSLGVQYAFSPESYKSGDRWDFYDRPLVVNYGAFYRLPLTAASPIGDVIATSPGSFGYDEATRKFQLPPPTGQAELNFYASRSTIDTGVMTLFSKQLYSTNGNTLDRQDFQQDLTVNNALGSRVNVPLLSSPESRAEFNVGFDFKTYELRSAKTNLFTLTSVIIDTISNPGHPVTNINVSKVASPVPTTIHSLDYLPLSLHYTASERDRLGVTAFDLGLSVNAWYSGSVSNLQNTTGSRLSLGHWVAFNPALSRDFNFHTNWTLLLRASGQWASEPLIVNEQFGIGGVGNVRGYHEGETFGNSGWWVTAEQQTPTYVVGTVYGRSTLSVRSSVYMGFGEAFLTSSRQDLWGTGFGAAASIGPNWEARLLFSWPLLNAGSTEAYRPRFNFSLSAQF